ncbi:MAG: sigma-70 family RNA polymerase sigma factor [Treponema sp.]|nr:sigma-70 family RNA polymerase sigma factor [Treponema sp.]
MSKNTVVSSAANAESSTINPVNKQNLSENDFLELLNRSKNGDSEAKGQLLLANQGLIYKIMAQINNPYVDKENLFADGCIRFLEIINDYDPEKAALSTYLWHPLIQYMNKNVPEYKIEIARFIGQHQETVNYLKENLGKTPTDLEVADAMGLSPLQYKNRLKDIRVRSTVSLDAPVNEDDDSTSLVDSALCVSEEDAASDFLKRETCNAISDAYNSLCELDRQTLEIRHNFDGTRISLREAAKKAGISTETIRTRELVAKRHFEQALVDYGVFAA